eukprot:5617449-Prymnesium_polylepis.1
MAMRQRYSRYSIYSRYSRYRSIYSSDTAEIHEQRYSRYNRDTVTPLPTPPYGKYSARYNSDTAQIQRDTADTVYRRSSGQAAVRAVQAGTTRVRCQTVSAVRLSGVAM